MGFMNVEWKNIAVMGKEKSQSLSQGILALRKICLCDVLQEELERFALGMNTSARRGVRNVW